MKKILAIALVCATLFSCQKDAVIQEESSLTGETAVKGALTNTDWVLKHTSLIYSPDLVDNGEAEACKQDDVYKFKLTGTADIEFGSNNCWAGLPVTPPASGSYGSWELQANGTVLKQIVTRDVPGFINGETIYWTVDYITANKMRIKRLVTEPGKTYTQMDTYIRR
jgi:hypothetical protein